MTGPLAGVSILDLSRLLPGPFASLVLADLGARVDKIEDTEGGDYMRVVPPWVGETSSTFAALNRNKRSACLDLKNELARDVFLKLVERYDVLLEQFRPGVLGRLGLGHEVLLARNPRLVVCALTGYGQDGPLRDRAGHDLNYLARSGLLGMQGPAQGPPQLPGFQIADIGGGLWCVVGILAALRRRDATGQGGLVDVAMVEAVMGFASYRFGQLLGGQAQPRGTDALGGGLALYGTYATKDGGCMALAAIEPKFWTAFCRGVGMETDMSAYSPGPHQEGLKERLRALFASRTRAEWEAFARGVDCCLEPVLEPGELRDDEHLRARGVFFEIDAPGGGRLGQFRTPVTAQGAEHRPPPARGEHTEAVLREAGVDEGTIAALFAAGAARTG